MCNKNNQNKSRQDIIPIWKLLPLLFWLQVIPLISTIVFVQAGRQLAELMVKNDPAITDITIVFLLINLFILTIVFYLSRFLDREPPIAALVKYVTIFSTVLYLFKLIIDNPGHKTNFVFGLIAILYFIVLPMTLYGIQSDSNGSSKEEKSQKTLNIFIDILSINSFYMMSALFAVLIPTTLFFVVMNPFFIRTILCIDSTQKFWLINPASLGIGAMQICFFNISYWNSNSSNLCFTITRIRFNRIIFLLSILVNACIAVFMIKDNSLLSQILEIGKCESTNSAIRSMFDSEIAKMFLKICLSLVFSACFFFVYYLCSKYSFSSAFRKILFCSLAFMFGGAISGLSFALMRLMTSVDFMNENYHLIWMHALGFLLAYIGMILGDIFIPKVIQNAKPIFFEISNNR